MKRLFIILFCFLYFSVSTYACTSVLISGKLTKDGRPLLLKNRDTDQLNNRIEYFKGEYYNFIGLVNSNIKDKQVWSGNNSAGFCIINTASYNLNYDDVDKSLMDREGYFMYKVLSNCKNLYEFEEFLNEMSTPYYLESNFGVMDAEGNAAFYEVSNNKWCKYDVNDKRIAPEGYLVYTNFSFSGKENDGLGYIRYDAATKVMKESVDHKVKYDPEWIFDNISRNFYNSILDINLRKDINKLSNTGFYYDKDFIPRHSTASSVIFQGVNKGENPNLTVMWTILGYPPLGIAVPVMCASETNQPFFMCSTSDNENSKLCEVVLSLKEKVYSIKRGNGESYINFKLMYNEKGDGYSQILNDLEKKNINVFQGILFDWRKNGFQKEEFNKFIENYSTSFFKYYESLINLQDKY
ncbi:MAG: hypothetical protein WC140_03010 [Bacteroidales bacterium]